MRSNHNSAAFSLIEVVLSLGLVVVAGFGLIGLMSMGLQTSLDSRRQHQAASIVESICSTRRAAPTADLSGPQPGFPLPALTNAVCNFSASTNLWLTADGVITSSASDARFGLLYNITPLSTYVPSTSPSAASVYLCLYWPAQSSPTNATTGRYEITTTFALP